MVDDNDKKRRFGRASRALLFLFILMCSCCVVESVQSDAYSEVVYDFEYGIGEVHVLGTGTQSLNSIQSDSFVIGVGVDIVNSPHAVNVGFQEVLDFIEFDETDENEYERDGFNCVNFSKMLHDNAEEFGIKAGVIIVMFEDNHSGHAFNVFNTTDKGLVFIDSCSGDRIIRKLKVGEPIAVVDAISVNQRDVGSFVVFW